MLRLALPPLVLFVALASTAAAVDEGDLTDRTYDLSLLAGPRVHRYGPLLGARPSDAVWEEIEEQGEEEEREPETFLEPDQLADLVRESVEPESWDEGGEIEVRGETLFVRNRADVLRRVGELLEEAEAAASRRVLFRVEVVSLPAGRYPDAAVLEEAAKDGALLESGSVETYPGIRTTLKVTNRIRYVRDFDVEISQTASIADPRIGAAEEGLAIDLVPYPTLDGDRVLVEALVRRGTFDRPIRQLPLDDVEERLGTVDLPLFRHVVAFTTEVVPSGGTLAIPFASEDRSIVVLVRVEVLGRGGTGRFLDAGALARSSRRYTVGHPPDAEPELLPLMAPSLGSGETEAPFGGLEGLTELLVSRVDPAYWEEEGRVRVAGESLLVVQARADVLERVRRFLRAREEEFLRPIRMDLRVYSVGGEVRAGATDSFDAEGARLLRAGRVAALAGRSAVVVAGSTMNFVADYYAEVAQEAQIADPVIGQSFEGLAANLVPRLSGDRSRVRIDIGLLLAHRSLEREAVRTGARYLGVLDGISEKRTVFNETLEFPAGGAYVIDAGPDQTTPGRRLAVLIRSAVD